MLARGSHSLRYLYCRHKPQSPHISSRPLVFPQYLSGTVPKRANVGLIVGLVSLPLAGYIARDVYQAFTAPDATLKPTFTFQKFDKWFTNLKFGQDDDVLTALLATPLSHWFLRTRFVHTSTPAVRRFVAAAVPLVLLRATAPVFFDNLLPSCSYFDKYRIDLPEGKRSSLAKLYDAHFALANRLRAEAEADSTWNPPQRVQPADVDPEIAQTVERIGRGAALFSDGFKVFSYFPCAILSYFWVEGGDEKYQDEYRAFLHGLQAIRNRPQK